MAEHLNIVTSSGRQYVANGDKITLEMGFGGLLMVNANVLTSVLSVGMVHTSGDFTSLSAYKASFGSETSGELSIVKNGDNIEVKNTIGMDTYITYKYIRVM